MPTDKVDINPASFEELQKIIYVGPDRTQQIIDLRPFKLVDDLTRVSGIGPARLKDIKEQGWVSRSSVRRLKGCLKN